MKKLASILLVCILLFNWVGYRLVTGIMEGHADAALQASVESNKYTAEELVEIRVPLNLPYQTDWKEFQSYDGSVRVNGVDYRYVKRKVEKGQLVLLCLPNHSKTHLATARDEFFMLVNDLQHNGHPKNDGKSASSIKNPATEYCYELERFVPGSPQVVRASFVIPAAADCLPGVKASLLQPPDLFPDFLILSFA